MSVAVVVEENLSLWLVDDVPARLFYAGERWTVTDTPTRLRESVWSVDPHDWPAERGLYGWRFQATNAAGDSFVFDVHGGQGDWHVHRTYC